MMNDKAYELGMSDTTFKNCHGLDEDGHVTSSYDIAVMSRELLTKYPEITNYTTIWMDTLRDGETQLSNTNRLIKNYSGATGLKTGSTSLALYNLSASATRDDLSLIAVIMKAPSTKVRFSEATKLLDYGFNNFSYQSFGKTRDLIQTTSIYKGIQATIPVVLESDAGILLAKGSEKNIEQTVTLDENISAPIANGSIYNILPLKSFKFINLTLNLFMLLIMLSNLFIKVSWSLQLYKSIVICGNQFLSSSLILFSFK